MDYTPLSSKVPSIALPHLINAMRKYNIDNPLRVSHFVSQCAHESNNFNTLQENLNYSWQGLRKTFPKYFPTDEIAKEYERKPDKIANKVYANRYGNGSEESGDGSLFKGRGYVQLTFKDNYRDCGAAIGEDLLINPRLLTAHTYASLSSAWYWNSRNLNAIADKGETIDIITQITKKINGGTHNLLDRAKRFRDIYQCLHS